MKIVFDPLKDARNLAKHGVSLALAGSLDWDSALIWPDTRFDYDEIRLCGLALRGTRLYFVVFTENDECYRIISLRKADSREVKRYVSHD